MDAPAPPTPKYAAQSARAASFLQPTDPSPVPRCGFGPCQRARLFPAAAGLPALRVGPRGKAAPRSRGLSSPGDPKRSRRGHCALGWGRGSLLVSFFCFFFFSISRVYFVLFSGSSLCILCAGVFCFGGLRVFRGLHVGGGRSGSLGLRGGFGSLSRVFGFCVFCTLSWQVFSGGCLFVREAASSCVVLSFCTSGCRSCVLR